MFGKKNQEKIEKLKEQVQQLRDHVPAEAVAFQRQCEEVLKAAGEMAGKWVVRDAELQGLQNSATRLSSLAQGITQLIRRAQAVAEQVRRLRESVSDDSESAFLIKKCDDWIRAVQDLGRDTEQDRHLQLDERRLLELENTVRNYARALELLTEAEKYCRELAPLDSALLKASLQKWKADFTAKGPSAQSLSELETLLEAPRREANKPPPPPRKPSESELQLRGVFDELRSWARVRNQRVNPALEDSYRRLSQTDSSSPEFQALRDNLASELKKLRDSTMSERSTKLQELRQDAGHYRRFCGENQELDERLERLSKNPADTPQNYQDWIVQYKSTDQFFLSIAQTKAEALAEGLSSCAAALEQRRQSMATGPLRRDVRNKIVALGASVGELNAANGQAAIREALRATDRIEKELAGLETQARQDLAKHDQRKSSLLGDIAGFSAAADACERPDLVAICGDLSNHLQVVESKSNDLDEMNVRLEQADGGLNGYIHTFVSECSLSLERQFDHCRDIHRAISTAMEALGESREPRFSRNKPQPATSAEVMRDYREWRELHQKYVERIQMLATKLKEAIGAGKAYLEQLVGKHGYLSPEQRHDAIELIRTLDEAASIQVEGADAVADFAFLANLLDRYNTFVHLVEGEREELRKAHVLLKDRLRKLNDEDFKRLFPEATERLSALVFGVDPDYPCGSTRKQLDLAFACLEVIETQSKRLVAEDMENAWIEAQASMRTPDKAKGEQLRAVLDEVREYAPQQMAPRPIRRRLFDCISQNGGINRA